MSTRLANARTLALDMQAAVSAFLNFSAAKNLSARTLQYYAERLRAWTRFLQDEAGETAPADVTPDLLRRFLTWTKDRTSPSTANHGLVVVRRMFNFLHAEGFCQTNPAVNVEKLKAKTPVVETFTAEQVEELLRVCRSRSFLDARDAAILLLLLDTGLRASELCSLTVDDLDWTAQTLTVIGKGDRVRVTPFGHAVHEALARYLPNRGEELETSALFVTHDGLPLSRFALWKIVRRRCEEANIEGVRCSPHSFRHTAAIFALRNGMDAFSVQKLLGHSSPTMTQRYLQSMTSEDVQEKHRLYSPADSVPGIAARNGKRRLR